MKIGEMRERINFKKKKETDGPVQNLTDYDDYCTVWAKVDYLKGKKLWSAKAANVETNAEFVIRYRKDIAADMLINFDNKDFEITSIAPLDIKRTYLVIYGKDIEIIES
ncbi:phage head closure protein [Natronincola ferrireducens]|uniref:Phage head-tail adaptor, putative, SPP1 family n=1 Tax=Natronincola ferrireducens TaxID=393762 RepID=A0A1G9I5N8_9FIRM|nr:phage head closure protein [Natronincola ferrireducens]SDL20412.1 phage head-tail adaptor, putative, SPP1 family [Natronincola ferrireducens]